MLTKYSGELWLNKPLDINQYRYIDAFLRIPHYRRNTKALVECKCKDEIRESVGLPYGYYGKHCIYVDPIIYEMRTSIKSYWLNPDCCGYESLGRHHTDDVPDIYCPFKLNRKENGFYLEIDNASVSTDKWYSWLKYLISNYFKPWGYKLNGYISEQKIDNGSEMSCIKYDVQDNTIKPPLVINKFMPLPSETINEVPVNIKNYDFIDRHDLIDAMLLRYSRSLKKKSNKTLLRYAKKHLISDLELLENGRFFVDYDKKDNQGI